MELEGISLYIHILNVENQLLFIKGSIPGSKNSEVMVTKSIKNINKSTILEKLEAAKKAKSLTDKKKK